MFIFPSAVNLGLLHYVIYPFSLHLRKFISNYTDWHIARLFAEGYIFKRRYRVMEFIQYGKILGYKHLDILNQALKGTQDKQVTKEKVALEISFLILQPFL